MAIVDCLPWDFFLSHSDESNHEFKLKRATPSLLLVSTSIRCGGMECRGILPVIPIQNAKVMAPEDAPDPELLQATLQQTTELLMIEARMFFQGYPPGIRPGDPVVPSSRTLCCKHRHTSRFFFVFISEVRYRCFPSRSAEIAQDLWHMLEDNFFHRPRTCFHPAS